MCSLLIFNTKEIRYVETEATSPRVQGQGCVIDGKRACQPVRGASHDDPSMERALLEGASAVFEHGSRKAPEVDKEQVKDLHVPLTGKTCLHV